MIAVSVGTRSGIERYSVIPAYENLRYSSWKSLLSVALIQDHEQKLDDTTPSHAKHSNVKKRSHVVFKVYIHEFRRA